MSRCLSIVLNPFTHDSRVLRQCEALAGAGHEVELFALHSNDLPRIETAGGPSRSFQVRRFELSTRGWSKTKPVQAIKYAECTGRMIREGIRFRPGVVHANDFLALPIGLAIARATGAKLVYDSHELWRGSMHQATFDSRLFDLALKLEGPLARRADSVITVSESIASILERDLRIARPTVVRNMPRHRSATASRRNLHELLDLPSDTPLVLYVGGTARGYGVQTLVEAFAKISSRAELVVIRSESGNGALRDARCLPPVAPDELVALASGATIGVCPIEDACESYRYSLPNKLFEYVQAGLPVIASDLPEMSRLVLDHGIGETFPAGDSSALAGVIDRLLRAPELLSRYRAAARLAARELSWENESRTLLEVYRHVANRPSDQRAPA